MYIVPERQSCESAAHAELVQESPSPMASQRPMPPQALVVATVARSRLYLGPSSKAREAFPATIADPVGPLPAVVSAEPETRERAAMGS